MQKVYYRSTMVYKTNKDEKKLNQTKLHLEKQNHLKTKDLNFVKGSGHANLFGNAMFIWEKINS